MTRTARLTDGLARFQQRIIIGIVGIAVLGSLSYSFVHRIRPAVDAAAYQTIAHHIVNGQGFREDPAVPFENDNAMLRAGPGYEYLLATIYSLFGVHIELIWILQAVMHGLSTWLIYLIARRLFTGEQQNLTGVFAAALYGFSPDLIEISAMLMTETSYLFFMILTVYLFVRFTDDIRENLFFAGSVGAGLGIAFLFRPPVALFLPIILFFFLRRRWIKGALLTLMCFIGILAPWSWRNATLFHRFIPGTLIGSYNLWINNLPNATGGQYSSPVVDPAVQWIRMQGVSSFAIQARQEFIHGAITRPASFVHLCILRTIRYFSLIRPMGFWFYQQGWPKILFILSSALSILILFASGYAGMWMAGRRNEHPAIPYLVAMTLSAPLVLIPTVVESRYRFQIYPFLAIWGGYAVLQLFQASRASRLTILKTFCILLGISLLDTSLFFSTILEHLRALKS